MLCGSPPLVWRALGSGTAGLCGSVGYTGVTGMWWFSKRQQDEQAAALWWQQDCHKMASPLEQRSRQATGT